MDHYINTAQLSTGTPAAGATISVFVAGTATYATIYSDNGVTAKANPFQAGNTGIFDFYVADGRYDINVGGANVIPYTLSDISIFDQQEGTSGVVVNAAEFIGADACAQINAAIAVLPSTGGVVDARSFAGLQVCNTAITYTGNTKGVQVLQGASTLQFSNSVSSPAINLTGAGSEWRGIGPEANTTGSSVIQAGTGFTGALFQLGTTAGDTNLALRSIKIDGNSQAGVTAGLFLNTAQNINWTLIDDVSIVNVTSGAGVLWGSGTQEVRVRNMFQRNNQTCMDMSAGAVGGATGGFWIDNPRLLCNGYAYIIGSDDAVAGNLTQGVWQRGGDIAVTGDGTKPMVLVRNARDIQFTDVWWEYSGASTGTTTAMLQVGTANTAGLPPSGVRVTGGHINGNNKVNYFADLENNTSANFDLPVALSMRDCYFLNNGATDALVRTPATNGGSNLDSTCGTVATSTAGFRAGSFGGSPFSMLAPMTFIGATGTAFMSGQVTGDTGFRVALQNNGVLRFGTGSGTFPLGLSATFGSPSTLDIGTGAQGSTAGNISATGGTFSGALSGATHATASNCSSSASPAVCGSAAAGSFVIAASATSVTVNTTAVTSNSQIFIQPDDSLGTKLGVTCNTTGTLLDAQAWVSARSNGTSFTVTINAAPSVNPECFSYFIVN